MVEDRPGIPDAEMDVSDGDEVSPPATPTPPEADPAGEVGTPGDAAAPDTAPTLPEKFTPPDRGDPFSFRVDRTDIPVEGARVIDDYIVLPRDAWDRQIRPNWLANRTEWRTREEQYKDQLRTLQTQTIPEERKKSQAILSELGSLLDGTPAGRDKLIAWLDNYEQNAPLLQQQAETRMLKEKLERYEREQAEHTTARQAEELRPRLQSYLTDQVAAAQKEFTALAGQKDLADRVWKFFAPRLYSEDHTGQIQFNHELFRDLMEDEHKRALMQVQQTAKVAEVAKKNAAAVGPARTPDGKYTKPVSTSRPAETRMSAEEWEADFNKRMT